MSTSTPRLQLVKPLGSESMKLGAAQISDAYAKIDAAIGVKKFATQGAATAVFNGDLINETSTGQSKLFNNPNWMNIWDNNNARGKPVKIDDGGNASMVFSGFGEQFISNDFVTVQAGRKYLMNVNFSLSAENNSGSTFQSYVRFTFKWTPNLSPTFLPNVFIHDVASYITASTSAKSKNFKAMFEFFPNVSAQVQLGLFGEIYLGGDEDLDFNLIGSTPSWYMMDWGV
jgi:hypothetical protein